MWTENSTLNISIETSDSKKLDNFTSKFKCICPQIIPMTLLLAFGNLDKRSIQQNREEYGLKFKNKYLTFNFLGDFTIDRVLHFYQLVRNSKALNL